MTYWLLSISDITERVSNVFAFNINKYFLVLIYSYLIIFDNLLCRSIKNRFLYHFLNMWTTHILNMSFIKFCFSHFIDSSTYDELQFSIIGNPYLKVENRIVTTVFWPWILTTYFLIKTSCTHTLHSKCISHTTLCRA